MSHAPAPLTWLERAQQDPSLRDFIDAELARAGVAVDTLRYQHDIDRQRIATLSADLAAAHAELTRLRRRLGQRHARSLEPDDRVKGVLDEA